MKISLTTVSSSEKSIGVKDLKLSSSAPRHSQRILAGFQPTTYWLAGGRLTTVDRLVLLGVLKEYRRRARMDTVDLWTISRRQEQVPPFADGLAY